MYVTRDPSAVVAAAAASSSRASRAAGQRTHRVVQKSFEPRTGGPMRGGMEEWVQEKACWNVQSVLCADHPALQSALSGYGSVIVVHIQQGERRQGARSMRKARRDTIEKKNIASQNHLFFFKYIFPYYWL